MFSSPLTILTIFGTRPEVIKLFPVIELLRQNPKFRNVVVSTSQHRQMIDDLLELFAIKPDHDLNIIRANHTLAEISCRALSGLDPLMQKYHPDLVLVQGDTTTALMGALSAFYYRIPVGHVEAGLRSFDKTQPYPEEINRRMISIIGDILFAPTSQNANNLIHEGTNPAQIFVTGNTVIDALVYIAGREHHTLEKYLPMEWLDSHRLILVTAHRRENWGTPLENLCAALKDVVRDFPDVHVVYPVHLNPNVRQTVFKELANCERIHLLDPLPYEPFVEAMARAYLIITDSGGIQEEGPSLHKPILVFRDVTERPEGIAAGGVKLIGSDRQTIVHEASVMLQNTAAYRAMIARRNPYGDGRAAQRIMKAILHYFGQADRPEDFVSQTRLERRKAQWNSQVMQTTLVETSAKKSFPYLNASSIPECSTAPRAQP